MKALTLVGVFSLAALSATAAPSRCSNTSDFVGTVIVDALTGPAVNLQWTVLETPDIESYQLIRMPAPATSSSSSSLPASPMMIAELVPDGEHLWTEQSYEFTDSAPKGSWIYRLIVRRIHARPCMVETAPLTILEHPPCGTVDVCGQVQQSFTGVVIISTAAAPAINLKWGSCAEDESVRGYRIERRRTGCHGSHCWRHRGFIRAHGSCGEVKMYSISDTPRAGEYSYRVHVLSGRRGRAVCTVELDRVTIP